MTFIQPHKHSSFLNGILVLFAIALVTGTVGMVGLYNATVNLDHSIAAAKTELDAVGAQNTAMNHEILAKLDGGDLAGVAAEEGLVTESKPQYFSLDGTTSQKWPIASHY
jgi:cell division protein FtsB